MGMRDDEELQNKRCWLFKNCPYHTGGCIGLPDYGCYTYRWFKKLILEDMEREDKDEETNS